GGFSAAFAGKLLAEGGAEVTRLVLPAGDPLEGEPPFFGATGISVQSTWYNLGKRRLRLADPEAAARAIAGADVLIEDGSARELSSSGQVRAVNARLAHISVTPFGKDGPRSSWRTNDLVANALSGAASVTGDASSGPLSGYGNQTHHTAGLYAAI